MRMAPLSAGLLLFTASAVSVRAEQVPAPVAQNKGQSAAEEALPAETTISVAHRRLLRRLLDKAGAGDAELVVVERTPEQQTRVMYDLAREDRQRAIDTYCKAGDRVVEVFDPELSEAENLTRMQAELMRQLPYARELGCLNHVRNDDIYAVDVAEDQVPNPEALIKVASKAVSDGRLERFLGPPRHPAAYHFELTRRSRAEDGSRRSSSKEPR